MKFLKCFSTEVTDAFQNNKSNLRFLVELYFRISLILERGCQWVSWRFSNVFKGIGIVLSFNVYENKL